MNMVGIFQFKKAIESYPLSQNALITYVNGEARFCVAGAFWRSLGFTEEELYILQHDEQHPQYKYIQRRISEQSNALIGMEVIYTLQVAFDEAPNVESGVKEVNRLINQFEIEKKILNQTA